MIICGDQLFYLDNLLSFILCIINLYTSNICDCDFTEFLSNGAIIPANQSLLQINETLLKNKSGSCLSYYTTGTGMNRHTHARGYNKAF